MTPKTTFERHEKKYLLNRAQANRLVASMAPYIREDEYGRYTNCSLYFDSQSFLSVFRAENKPVYKEKLRLRSYGVPGPDTTVFLELKKKLNGITYKRRVPLTQREAQLYIDTGRLPEETSQIFEEIDWFRGHYGLEPQVALFYDRIAFSGRQDEGLRITFDTDVRYRFEDLDLSLGDWGEQLLSAECVLMEIKVPGAMPKWLTVLLSEVRAYPTSFSKYMNTYNQLVGKGEIRHAG